MGLFSNNKKPCPLCGSPTPRLLATKVEDMPLCKECAGKIDLPDGALDRMTLAQLEQYMAFYEENAALRETFSEDYRYGFGLLSGALVVDSAHRLLRIKPYDSALVFGPENLQSFRILEDSDPLFTGNADGLTCHRSDVPDKVEALIPSIDQFMRRKQDFEHMEEMHRMMDRDRDHDHDHPRPPRPEFVCTPPVRKFRLELTFSHPYWKSFTQEIGAPDFSSQYPSARTISGSMRRRWRPSVSLPPGSSTSSTPTPPSAGRMTPSPQPQPPLPPLPPTRWRRFKSISCSSTPVSSPRRNSPLRKSSFWASENPKAQSGRNRGLPTGQIPCKAAKNGTKQRELALDKCAFRVIKSK